MILTANKTENL